MCVCIYVYVCMFGVSIWVSSIHVAFKEQEVHAGGSSFRLGLRRVTLGLALLVTFDAGAAHDASHGEGQVSTPATTTNRVLQSPLLQ